MMGLLFLEVKKHSCQDACEHHKESRKCDCAYCEVFGAVIFYIFTSFTFNNIEFFVVSAIAYA